MLEIADDSLAAQASAVLDSSVARVADLDAREVGELLRAYGARLVVIPSGREIPGSYWCDAEAGLIEGDVFVRVDTPAHSLLHELCHYVCMDEKRRAGLATDAGGDDDEECAVCYLQVLLADALSGFGRARCLADMDEWGYSFREGSADAWFMGDARFARDWLLARGLIRANDRPTYELRKES